MHMTYNLGPDLYIVDWLSKNNPKENKDQDIEGMRVSVNDISPSINIPVCTFMQDIQTATHEDVHLQELKMYII